MAVKLSFKGVGSGASENEAQMKTAEKIEALQAQKRQLSGGRKWNLHISQCGIRTPIIVSSIASSANRENDLFLLAGIFISASISQNSSTTSQVKLDLLQPRSTDQTSRISLLGPSCFDSLSTPCIWTSSLRLNHDVLERIISGLETTGEKAASQLQDLETIFVDFNSATDEKALASIRPNSKLIWIETPTNTTLRFPPITRITSLIYSLPATSRPLIVIDSTFLSPFYVSPLAVPISTDLAIHSIAKYINRHSDVLMSAVILPNASTAGANGNIRRKYPPLSGFLITVLFRL
ncbi:hypothetical protein M422DRAFT_266251 [Sphaerobolus stellatus SS14]|uniref:cystathionine gamma-lyase n=1 Tax=Sphaerobolus stellatus (strain SS14) TaxID=990650 RepID=A0A0C9UBK6_SPHS4|nr:hypothetical protein M422DRAFT_266251 [Sphaerobolus stellatus SS14]